MPAQFEDVTANATTTRRGVARDLGGHHYANRSVQDDIVISGFSGRLPESSNIEEFAKNLYDGIDMVNDEPRRWPTNLYDLPGRIGKIKDDDLESFDQQFFSVHQKQAECMDPQMRLLLECTYEAIIDAGINPVDIRGSRTGVYIGVSTSEIEQYWCGDPDRVNGYGLTGCARAMFANRVSFTFDFKGPSFATDTACSSSLFALSQAFEDIQSGKCDSAVVAGTSILLKPTMSLQFKRLGMLALDGKCKAFDESGAGYVRSEGVVVIFLQRAATAKRIYASILNVLTNTDGGKENGITFPDGNMQNRLIRETYAAVGINGNEISYIEAHGTGTKAGDPQEVNSITDFFCKDRNQPLLMGSVKSNMGHSEPASGVCSIAKVLIAMENGVIPANLHFKSPNPDLYGIIDRRLKVVDQNTPFPGGIVGLNSFGFGGANAHVILKSNPKPKIIPPQTTTDTMPKLVVVSGRTGEAVEKLLASAELHRDDEEYLGLINDIHKKNIPLHYQRGYVVITPNSMTGGDVQREVVELIDEKRPIWYIYSGMGSQWAGMARDLMQIECFKESIRKCADALRPEGIDLVDIITQTDEKMFDNILNSFVAIAAIQVALTDLLTYLGISPAGIVGHSVGELGCAYADGCFTPEQTVLAAYWRGKSIVDTKLMPGLMAAVGLSWTDCKKRLPAGVFAACHNSEDSVTISGPTDSINKFVEQLNKEGVFAKQVKSSGCAFHSKYIADAGPKLRKSLDRIIPSPKNRTSRWVSSSIPESGWNTPMAQQSSAAYHVNNLLSPVLFHEAVQQIPKNAICIEIAPTGLLQAILKRSLGSEVTNLSLLRRGHENNLQFLLTNVGKLYAAGGQPNVPKLYRPISFPVSRGTPMLNSQIGWDHSTRFTVPRIYEGQSTEAVVEIDLSKEEDAFIAGHTIDGRVLFPATGYMTLVWRTFAKTRNTTYEKLPVVIEDIVFHRATIMPKGGSVKFGVSFFEGSNQFEICESGALTVSGKITVPENIYQTELPLAGLPADDSGLVLNMNDVYKELRLRGYDYSGKFRGITESDSKATTGTLKWDNDWISYMDTMLQFSILGKDFRELYLPTRIEKCVINPEKHLQLFESRVAENKTENEQTVPVYMYRDLNVIKSGGVEMRGLRATLAPRRAGSQSPPTLEQYTFVPFQNSGGFNENEEQSKANAVTVSVQLVIENSSGALKLKVADACGEKSAENILAKRVQVIIESEPTLVTDVAVCTNEPSTEAFMQVIGDTGIRVITKNIAAGPIEQNCHLAIGYEITARPDGAVVLQNLHNTIRDDGFILLEENIVGFNEKLATKLFATEELTQVSCQRNGNKFYILLRNQTNLAERNKQIIRVNEKSFKWLDELKTALSTAEAENKYVYVVSEGEELFGAVGFMNCIKFEAGGRWARLVYVQDKNVEKFDFNRKIFAGQLEKDLIFNVYRQGSWGTFRHLKLEFQSDSAATLQVEHSYINALVKGDLSSLSWIEGPLSRQLPDPTDKSVELCTVYYAPINFRDVMLTTGKLAVDALPGKIAQQDCVLGMEFAGRDSTGKRVMAMVQAKSLATTCVASRNLIWDIPDNWSMADASTVPCVYSTVYYALVVRGRLRRGESILIHAGSGGVGQAAISVALHYGLTVYTTVGSVEKREFIKKTFPQLTDKNIANSRDTSFEQFIMSATKGKGVDLVLNSLAEDKLQASVRCLGLNGRFLEIGKLDLNNNSPLGMGVFLKNSSFHGILLDSIMEQEGETLEELHALLSEGIRNGAVRPLPVTIFNEKQVEQAFRFMATGKHIGKVVIKVRQEESDIAPNKQIRPIPKMMTSIPRTYMHKEKTYIIVGGLGGFGLELANWMVNRGAMKLVLTSRSGIKTGYQSLMTRRWKESGINIVIDTNDVTTQKGAELLLTASNKIGPVGGIFNLAAVLHDRLIDDLTEKDFASVCIPKVDGTKYLDSASRKLCPDLDYFICFSSVSCGRGNIGQSNYGLANSAMERICEHRQTLGLPGTAIQWGAIGDTGLVIENLGDNETVIGGTLPQRMVSCLKTMDYFMQQPHAVLASMVVAEKRKSDSGSGVSLVKCVANILGLKDLKNVPDQASLADLGMDSLMGAEIKQTLERNYDVVLSVPEIRQLSFGKLKILESGSADPSSTSGDVKAGGQQSVVGDGTQVVFTHTELLPHKCLVNMKSKASPDSKQRPLFVVHAIEGFVTALETLVSKLDCPVWGLQCTSDAPMKSLEQLATYYVSQIKRVQPVGPYTIAGYSFGAAIAFEMVIDLEQHGEKAELIMFDGSPKYVNWFTQAQRHRAGKDTEISVVEEEAMGLSYFGLVFANLNYGQTAKQLVELESFKDRLTAITAMVHSATNHSEDEVSQTAELFFQKLVVADSYRPQSKVKANVTLFKATDNITELSHDYGLADVCKNKVDIVTVNGDHRTILTGDSADKIADILQKLVI